MDIKNDLKTSQTLLEVRNLKKYFNINGKVIKALDGISFFIQKGETLAVVGESGAGKSILSKTLIKLQDVTDGEVIFDWMNVHALNKKGYKNFSKRAQIIFKDSNSSLNPYMTIGDIVAEGLDIHGLYRDRIDREKKVIKYLKLVGLSRGYINRFPQELSGEEKQRVAIARALIIRPDFIICDEIISDLDITDQAQIITLLKDLQKEMGLTYLFTANDLSMVMYLSDGIAIMLHGSIVEITSNKNLYNNPTHPYTKVLLSSIPGRSINKNTHMEKVIPKGGGQNLRIPSQGCKFQNRCPYVTGVCKNENPELKEINKDHFVACHLSQ